MLCSTKRLEAVLGLPDALEADLAAQDDHGFKKRRRILASADCDRDGLEGLSGLQTQVRGCRSKCLIQRIMVERGSGEHLPGLLQDTPCKRSIALLRYQFRRVIRRELRQKKEVGGRDGVAQQLDAFADERRHGQQLFVRRMETVLLEEGLDAAAELLHRQSPNMLGVEPQGLGIEGVFLGEIN